MDFDRQAILNNDYNPYENRNRLYTTNKIETLAILVKGILGTGILALPDAFKNAGYGLGIVGSAFISFLIALSLNILFDNMYFICKRDNIPQISYPEAFKEGLKKGPYCCQGWVNKAPSLVNFFVAFYQQGVLCVYMIFVAENIKQVIDVHTDETTHFSVEIYMIMFLPIFMLICFIKDLKKLATISTIANWLTLGGLLCIYFFFFHDVVSIRRRTLIGYLTKIPLFIGTAMFSVLSIGPLLLVEMNMENGADMRGLFGVLNIGITIVTILNIFTGFCGYWKYGEETEGVITLNIDIEHPMAQGVRILFSMSLCLSFAVHAYPITEILWEQYIDQYMETTEHEMFWDFVCRSGIVLLAFILAIGIPHIELFISLFGAFCLSVLGVIFPSVLDICIRWPDDFGNGNVIFLRDLLLILFGICGWCFGTYSAIQAIALKLYEKHS